MASVPLSRPALPTIETPLSWCGSQSIERVVAVFGPGDLAFARSIAAHRDACLVRPELRHRPGFRIDGEQLFTHPDTLMQALAQARPDASLVIGVGGLFALAVEASPLIWLTSGDHPIALPSALRELAQRADLALETARPALAREIAQRL